MTIEEFGKFMMSKPFVTFPSVIALVLGLLYMGFLGRKTRGNWFENIDFLRQKMAPAFNETTGFLVISYAVIICIGNVIMKTSPKYLASGGESQEEKTSGFVAWLQSKGLGWLPIFISVTIVTLMTFLPINNKMLKIGIIAIVLGGVLVAALFFNAIIKLFAPKEESTDVKEEFGHPINNKEHDLNIHVGINSEEKVYTVVDYDGEGVEKHNINEKTLTHTYEINGENLTNTVTIKLHEDTAARIFITDKPIGQTSGDHNAREVSQKEGEEISITVEGPEKKIYVHAISDGIKKLYQDEIKKITGPSKQDIEKKAKLQAPLDALTAYETARKAVEGAKGALETAVQDETDIETKATELETETKEYSEAIYKALLKINGNPVPNSLVQVVSSKEDGINLKENKGLIITLKNMEQFFGFDVNVVKQSVRDSYIAYYCLVWGSLLVYSIVTAIQQRTDGKSFLRNIGPFIIAAGVETLLIGQSHWSLDESDVASRTGEASATFNYAVAGFSTRIATIVAFLSSILTQVKD
jgi:hypothetical protein